jgi:GTP-binding protein
MTIKSLELETVCGITSKLPQHDKIEMAFWGRSNVGVLSFEYALEPEIHGAHFVPAG